MSCPRSILAAVLGLWLWLVIGGSAAADQFGTISLVDQDAHEQADVAQDPAISADGRVVAFDGSFAGISGVYEKNLQTGAVSLVAGGDAALPSVSADGRYVSFTTTAALDKANDPPGQGDTDVYVRDMSRPIGTPGALVLASALDGVPTAITYQSGGAVAAGRSALSADGRHVAFVVTGPSNMETPAQPGGTPAYQVAVRDLDTMRTRLVSAQADPNTGRPTLDPLTGQDTPVPDGAAFPNRAEAFGSVPQRYVGASLSADGTTVAWLGVNVGEQALVKNDARGEDGLGEPLWRRIADGPAAVTRRVTGGSDFANSACAATGETTVNENSPDPADPCQGPFVAGLAGITGSGDTVNGVPQLSADGRRVAFLASAPPLASQNGFGQDPLTLPHDAYVADMSPGLSRSQALTTLTEQAGGSTQDPARTGDITDIAISADGTRIAFTSRRTVFPLSVPAFVSTQASQPIGTEVYYADLATNTLTRLTQGYDGSPTSSDSASPGFTLDPSISGDGNTAVFASTGSNLVYGDGNSPQPNDPPPLRFDGSDVFAVSRQVFATTPPQVSISSPPASLALGPAWRMDVSATSQRDGSVLLDVAVPGSGTLSASARGLITVTHTVPARARRVRGRRAARARRRKITTLSARMVAAGAEEAQTAATLELTLRLAPAFAARARQPHGLGADVTVTFRGGGPTLSQVLPATFRSLIAGKPARRRPHRRPSRSGQAHRRTRRTTGGRKR